MNTILIIEDDTTIRTELKNLLEKYDYRVIVLDDFTDVTNYVINTAPELVLLDLMLPCRDGYYICREIRKKSFVPIIVVTSRDTEMDELICMHLGADDFMTKPYNTQILLARIENILRRSYGIYKEALINVKGVSLNLYDSTVRFGGQIQELTKNEAYILRLLMKNEGKIIPRAQIMIELWQSDEFVDENTLTVNINRLRKKLCEIGIEGLIQTKRGQGYII